jgi:hypothetical protein
VSAGSARLTTPDTTYKQNMPCCRITTSPHMNTHILIQWVQLLGTHELPDDDQLLIETCRSAFKCSGEWHFKLMFYYIEVHLLAHYIQWIKMHGETVKSTIPNLIEIHLDVLRTENPYKRFSRRIIVQFTYCVTKSPKTKPYVSYIKNNVNKKENNWL